MIGTEESHNESMIMNAASRICDNNQGFNFKSFPEECFKLRTFENIQTGVKGGLKHNKRHDIAKFNKGHYDLQKISC